MKDVMITSIVIVLFLILGVLCLVLAARITRFYRKYYASDSFLRSAVMLPFRAWVESDYYETSIRIFGVLMILMAVFLAFVMIRGLLG